MKFGIAEKFIDWVMGCICDPSFAVLVNGSPTFVSILDGVAPRRSFVPVSLRVGFRDVDLVHQACTRESYDRPSPICRRLSVGGRSYSS